MIFGSNEKDNSKMKEMQFKQICFEIAMSKWCEKIRKPDY